MKRIILIVIAFSLTKLLSAQESSEKTQIDEFIKQFNQKMDTVQWLCAYDDIAWWTSDSVYATSKEEQSKLGSEWFCFEKDLIWHALYGKFENGNFQMAYHYTVDSNQIIKRVNSSIDTIITNSYSRALINGSNAQKQYPDSIKVRFNQYIKKNPDGTLLVWFLPAFTRDGIAVYGGEFSYLFDASGNNMLNKYEFSTEYRGYKPDQKKEIWLDYEKVDYPTLGSIFFVWYYRRYFDRIVIDAKKFKSTVFHDEKGYYWVHAKKE
jgi:hypothetical protein